jgi:hypothetical protein
VVGRSLRTASLVSRTFLSEMSVTGATFALDLPTLLDENDWSFCAKRNWMS